MSNLVDMEKSVPQNNAWGNNTSIPHVASSQAKPVVAQVPVSNGTSPSPAVNDQSPRSVFRESTVRLQVMASKSLKSLSDKSFTMKIMPNHAQQIFKPENSAKVPHDIHQQVDSAPADLSKGIITKISVLSTCNEFPVPVKVDFTGQGEHANCFDLCGNQAPLFLYPGEQTRGNEFEIYNAKESVDDPFLKRYGHVSIDALCDSIQPLKNSNFVYVPMDHDAIRLIRLNPSKFGPAPSKDDVREGVWYKMERSRIANAIQELHQNIISKFKFTDLSKFTVNISRTDGKAFNDLKDTKWGHLDQQEQDYKMNELLHVGFELKLSWAVPHQDKKGSFAPGQSSNGLSATNTSPSAAQVDIINNVPFRL